MIISELSDLFLSPRSLNILTRLGHGGLSAISNKASPTASSPSSTTESTNSNSCVSGSGEVNNSMLVMSGGEGYIDFRLGKI